MSAANDDKPRWDPVFLHARREALMALACWAFMLVWIIGVCWNFGYDIKPEDAISPLGLPHWVLYGILIPWLAAGVFSFWYALIYVADDDLGSNPDEGPPEDEPAEGAGD